MGVRFSKRISFGPWFRVNLGKQGVSFNVGPRGKSLTVGPRGAHVNVALGWGLSLRERIGSAPRTSSPRPPSQAAMKRAYAAQAPDEMPDDMSPAEIAATVTLYPLLGSTVLIFCFVPFTLPLYFAWRWKYQFNAGVKACMDGRYKSASKLLRASLENGCTNDDARFLIAAISALVANAPGSAIRAIDQMRSPPVYAVGLKVMCLLAMRRLDDVVSTLQRRTAQDGVIAEEPLRIVLARVFLEKGQPSVAAEVLRSLPVTSARDDWFMTEARYWLGVALARDGKADQASGWFAKVQAVDAEHRCIAALATGTISPFDIQALDPPGDQNFSEDPDCELAKADEESRPISGWLLVGLFFLAPIFCWVTLGPGYSRNTRIAAFGWAAIWIVARRIFFLA